MINFNSCNLQLSQAFRRFNCLNSGSVWGSCMGRTGARAPTPWGRRRQHYVSPWPRIAVLSGPVPHIASSSAQLWMRHAVSLQDASVQLLLQISTCCRHRPTGNKAQRPQPKRAHQTTDRPATQPPSPSAREQLPTLAQQFRLNLTASPV